MRLKKHILDLLQKIGLGETEAKLYLAALDKPGSTLKELEIITGLSTATVYRAFEKLQNLHLLTSSNDNWKKCVNAVSLRAIGEKLASEQRKMRKVELELRGLDNLYELSNRSFMEDPVQILSDPNQLYDKYFEILHRPWEKIFAYGSGEKMIEIIGHDTEDKFVDIRCRKGRKADVVVTELGDYGKSAFTRNEMELRNMRIMENEKDQGYMEYIYGDELTIWHKDAQFGARAIVVKDPVLVDIHKQKFAGIWNS